MNTAQLIKSIGRMQNTTTKRENEAARKRKKRKEMEKLANERARADRKKLSDELNERYAHNPQKRWEAFHAHYSSEKHDDQTTAYVANRLSNNARKNKQREMGRKY